MSAKPAAQLPPRRDASRRGVYALLLGWAWLAGLWGTSQFLTQLPAWGWFLAVWLLCALPAWGLWLVWMLRKKVLRFQFSAQGRVGRWLSGGWWPACKALLWALLLCSAALWQSWFLAAWEWALLALAVPLYLLAQRWLQARLHTEFSASVFAWAWSQRLTQWALVLLLGGLWMLGMVQGLGDAKAFGGSAAQPMTAQALDAAIVQIRQAPSGLVRWGLDTLLALQLAGDAVADLPRWPLLRWVLLALWGPVGLLWCVGAVMQGALGGRAIGRQAMPEGAKRQRPAVPLLAMMGVLVLGIGAQTTASLDGLALRHESPLALQRLPECERIGQQLYRLGTLEQTRQQALQALGAIASREAHTRQALCQSMAGLEQQMQAAVERYLDWYFSLGAEWGRVLSLLTGDVGDFLQDKLVQTLSEAPALNGWAQAMQQAYLQEQGSQADLSQTQQKLQETLARHHLALNADQCIVRAEVAQLPALDWIGDARQRLAASALAGLGAGAGAGVGAGMFAAAVASKAMGKTSMKAASKVLAKAAAKQGLGKAGSAALGAALGSVAPGVGTAAGAVAGALAGVLIGVGIDWAALYAEEKLSRDAMRSDLLAALQEQLSLQKKSLACEG